GEVMGKIQAVEDPEFHESNVSGRTTSQGGEPDEVGVREVDCEHAGAAGENLAVEVVDGRGRHGEATPGAQDDAVTFDGVADLDAAQKVDMERSGGKRAPIGEHR